MYSSKSANIKNVKKGGGGKQLKLLLGKLLLKDYVTFEFFNTKLQEWSELPIIKSLKKCKYGGGWYINKTV